MNDDDRPAQATQPGQAAPRRRGLEGRTVGGRYQVQRTVAAGANTLIADAHDIELDRTVTIKLVRPELSEAEAFRRAFRKQMDEMASISHPNVAAVYDWGEEKIGKRATVYAVVEYLSGGSMRDLFDRGRTLTPSQALMVGLEACRGLDFAHRKGLVHTELTPSKLVFGDDRRLRIVDFGLSRILGEQDWQEPSRIATHVARYASPEQAEGKSLDGRTDVYSLALILIEAVTGSIPFVGDSTVATLSARIGKLMPVSADLGPLAAVLERAGRPEAAERFSASQFGRALVRTAEKLPRPTPIPVFTTGLFDDPASMRAPDDPTGGIARPPAEPEPVLVPPSPTPVSPTDATTEIEAPAAVTVDVAPSGDAATEEPVKAISSLTVPDRSVETTGSGGVGTSAPSPVSPAPEHAPGTPGHEFDDLAELVERTPEAPTPPPDRPAGKAARRGARSGAAGAPELESGKPKTRRELKKEAKARRKAAEARDKAPAAGAQPDIEAAPVAAAQRRRRRWVPWFAGLFLLAVLGGLGYLAWVLFRTPTHEVPEVVGLPQAEALDLVDDFEWRIDVEHDRDDEFRTPGEIISMSPPAGKDLAEGSPLLLVVSDGPEYRTLPDLSGVAVADAQALLEELELAPLPPTMEFSEEVAEGIVISASAEGLPEDALLPGSEVGLVVSDGPQSRRSPQLRGLTVDQATQLLTDLGLTLSVGEEVFDNEVPAGEIAVQSPAVDTSVERGTTIAVNVSKGPDLVTVPDLDGLTLPEIDQALIDAGLRRGPLLGARSGTFVAASVDGDEVGAGDQVLRNSEVFIIILVQ